MTRGVGAIALLVALAAAPAAAQSVTTEVETTVGRATEGVTAGAVQARVFGATASDWRFFVEGAWGDVSRYGSDVFGAAYPYDDRVRPVEVYGEKMMHAGALFVDVRGGRYRTPFGLSNRSDQAYIGFARPPLIRYGGNFALGPTFLEHGADVLIGNGAVQIETSVGAPGDLGEAQRAHGLDVVVRGQAYWKTVIVGASFLRSQPVPQAFPSTGSMRFGGVDARWMSHGIQLRGEWMFGQPFDTTTTSGGYIDAILHHIGMGPVTLLARAERLDYDVPSVPAFSLYKHRYTAGARVRILDALSATVGLVHQPYGLAWGHTNSLDVGLTLTVRR